MIVDIRIPLRLQYAEYLNIGKQAGKNTPNLTNIASKRNNKYWFKLPFENNYINRSR